MNDNKISLLTDHVQTLLAEAFQVSKDLITPELAFGDLPQWDSLGHMEIMLRLEEIFNIEVNTDTIAQLVSFPEICRYIQEQGYLSKAEKMRAIK